MNPRTAFFLALVGVTLLRVWVVFGSEVSPANAYFYLCSEHPDAAYFDGPSGTAVSVGAARLLGGEMWMLLGPIWAALASLASWRLGTQLSGETPGALAGLALNCVPAFNAAALTVGPVAPTLAFVLAGLLLVWNASRAQSATWRVWASWVLGACCFGVATAFSYEAAAVGPVAFAAVLARRAGRVPGAILGLVLTLAAVALALAPALLWNAQKAWIPIAGWTPRALISWDFGSLASGIFRLGMGLSPFLAVAVLWAVCRAARGATQRSADAFALAAALPGILWVVLSAYRGWESGMAALVPAAILLPVACAGLSRSIPLSAATLLAGAVLSLPVFLDARRAPEAAASAAEHLLDLDHHLSPDVPGGLFYIADDPALAASLSYHLRQTVIAPERHPRVYVKESQDISNQFSLWPSYDDFVETESPPDEFFEELSARNPFVDRSAIYVSASGPEDLPQAITSAFTRVEVVREVKGVYIYLCLDYQTLPL